MLLLHFKSLWMSSWLRLSLSKESSDFEIKSKVLKDENNCWFKTILVTFKVKTKKNILLWIAYECLGDLHCAISLHIWELSTKVSWIIAARILIVHLSIINWYIVIDFHLLLGMITVLLTERWCWYMRGFWYSELLLLSGTRECLAIVLKIHFVNVCRWCRFCRKWKCNWKK